MSALSAPFLRCWSCNESYPLDTAIWKCRCGGVLDVAGAAIFPKDQLAHRPMSFWRYREGLALPDSSPGVSLGEVMTPLLDARFRGWDVSLKLEYVLPTGSYKDRGVAVCLDVLARSGVSSVAEDSSGNAGASTAAYAAVAGIRADIYIPEGASPAKVNQIRIYGARCHLVPGTRTESAREAQAVRDGCRYIGHSWSPLFACGIKSLAYEIAEQRNWCAPDWIVTPAGGGSLVMGLIDGFADLLAAGYISRLPRILAVQSAACAPIHQAWHRGDAEIAGVPVAQTVAEGVALPHPPRGNQVLHALRRSNGTMLAVDDDELLSSWQDMARTGIFMEPTSAVAVAGAWLARSEMNMIEPDASVIIVVTGHGLKTKPTLLG